MNYFVNTTSKPRKLTRKQLDMRQMHWQEYLDKYPLANGNTGQDSIDVDYDNRLDNWDDPETYDEPQANE